MSERSTSIARNSTLVGDKYIGETTFAVAAVQFDAFKAFSCSVILWNVIISKWYWLRVYFRAIRNSSF
jgi:hypothetical protein